MDAFTKITVEDIAQDINSREIAPVLFLGSRTGSLFRGTALANTLKGYSFKDLANKTRVERFAEWYTVLDRLRQNELALHSNIQQALQEKVVSVADNCLAQLMKERKFEYIITTNIGNEEELTFLQNEMKTNRDFEVIAPGSAIASAGNKFKIIKASGDTESEYSICGYTIKNRKNILLDMYTEPRKSIDEVRKRDMLMVGFDAKWDNHVLHAVFPREEGRRVWYVNEEPSVEKNSQLFFYLKACKARCLEGSTGKYELFFMNLCEHMLGSIPTQQILDKLTSIEKMLLEMQKTYQQFQEMTMKDIKGSIAKLSENVDVLLECCNNISPKNTSHSIHDPLKTHTKDSSTPPERKTGRTRKSKAV